MFQVAKILEGLPRHVSTHAAGVVISDKNLLDLVPLQEGSDGIWLTQFTMNDVEAIGLLKMDFLGLRNLSIIDNTLKGIKRISQQIVTQKEIPLDDPATLRLFQKGETAGIFQFESAGIRNVLRKLGPESIEDIAAVNALYRPGPLDSDFAKHLRNHCLPRADHAGSFQNGWFQLRTSRYFASSNQ